MGMVLDHLLNTGAVMGNVLEDLSRVGGRFAIIGNDIYPLTTKMRPNCGGVQVEDPDEPEGGPLVEDLQYEVDYIKSLYPAFFKNRDKTPKRRGAKINRANNDKINDNLDQDKKDSVPLDPNHDSGRQTSNGGDLYGGNGTSGKKVDSGLDSTKESGKQSKTGLNEVVYTNEIAANTDEGSKDDGACKKADLKDNGFEEQPAENADGDDKIPVEYGDDILKRALLTKTFRSLKIGLATLYIVDSGKLKKSNG